MHKFKNGDLVRHIPSGCVLPCEIADGDWVIISSGAAWPVEDCEPYRDPAPVIEAAKRFLDYFDDDQYSKAAREMLKEALDTYRGQPLEPERVPTLSEPDEPNPEPGMPGCVKAGE